MNKKKLLNILKNSAAVVVIAAMFVVIFYQNRDRDIFKFGKEESSKFISSSQDTAEGFSGGDIARLKEGVVFLTTTSYCVLDENAQGESVPIAMSEPQLHTEEDYAVCYNLDSREVTVFKKNIVIYTVKTDNKILRAKVNKNGYLFVATEKEGYNCECLVYNRKGEAIFKWDVSKSEFLDGDINCSNNAIAISLAAAGNKKLVGEVSLIDITDAEIIKKETFDSEIFYDLNFNNNDTYTLLGNRSLTYFNSDGTKRWAHNFGKDTLLKADVSNHDMMVVAFASSSGIIEGSSTKIQVINRLGKVTAQKNFDSVIDDVAINDNSIALVFGKKVYVTNAALKERKTFHADYSIKKAALFDDGKHLFVLGNSGGKILK